MHQSFLVALDVIPELVPSSSPVTIKMVGIESEGRKVQFNTECRRERTMTVL